jgi:DNA repair protein RadC
LSWKGSLTMDANIGASRMQAESERLGEALRADLARLKAEIAALRAEMAVAAAKAAFEDAAAKMAAHADADRAARRAMIGESRALAAALQEQLTRLRQEIADLRRGSQLPGHLA